MNILPVLTLAALLAVSTPALAATFQCGQPCRGLMLEAQALEGQAKYREALARYQAASTAAPEASAPLSMGAGLMLKLSTAVPKENAAQLRQMSRGLARKALSLIPDDPVAQEVLRMLDDDGPSPLKVPNARAARSMAEGENLFAREDYKGALPKYEATMLADPRYSSAWVAAGNTYFAQKDWKRAEALFRQATEIEPYNSQAWRYLSDALLYQGQRAAAEAALYKAIEADPSQRPNWSKLARFRAGAGLPLKTLALQRGVRVVPGPDGKYAIELDSVPEPVSESVPESAPTPDHAFRVALGVSEVKLRTDDKAGEKSAFEIELAAWRLALRIADEVEANSGQGILDPGLLQIRALAREGQLEPAILLLMFRQAYRPALEAWTAANPGGVKTFIDRHGVQP